MKNIIYIANIRIPTEKAHGIQVMKMCEAFANQGMVVELVVPGRLNKIKEDPFDYYGVKRNFKITKLPCLDLVRFGKAGFWIQALSFAEVATWFVFWKKFKREKFICYTREELVAFYLSSLGIKVVWEAHTGKNNFLTTSLVKRGVKIVCISSGVANFYKNLGTKDENLLIAHDGVDLEKFNIQISKDEARGRVNLPKDKKIVLYTGHLYDWKGAHVLADSAKFLDKSILIVFVGGTDVDIEKFKKEYALNKNIKVVGRVSHNQIPIYLKAADLLVLPNSGKEDISRFYTSPLKLFEYMASGIPIIASDLPSIREILNEESAYFFEADNSESLAGAINKVIENQEEFLVKGKKAKAKVADFSWENRVSLIFGFVSKQ